MSGNSEIILWDFKNVQLKRYKCEWSPTNDILIPVIEAKIEPPYREENIICKNNAKKILEIQIQKYVKNFNTLKKE